MWWFCIFFNLVEKTLLLSDKHFVSKCGNRSHVVLCFSHSSYTANVSTDNIQRAVTLPWNAVLGKSWRFSWRSVCQRIWAGCVQSQKAQVKQVHLAHCTLNSQCLQHNDRNWTRESFNLFLLIVFFHLFLEGTTGGSWQLLVLSNTDKDFWDLQGWKEKKNHHGVIFLRLQDSFCIGECSEPMASDRGDFRIVQGVQA